MNPRSAHRPFRGLHAGKGSILVLSALGMLVLIVAAAFSVDIAYMQLTREELHIATDAAAKAAVAKLSQGGTDDEAKAAGIACAAANSVGSGPLVINASQITLGKVAYSDTGHWPFTEGGTPKIAAKVDVTMSNNTVSGPVRLFFGKVFGTPYFNPSATSTAAFVRNKVCLCLDRSHSMCFDTSGTDWRYPSPYGTFEAPKSTNYWRGYKVPPNLTGSRWLTLSSAIDTFLTTVANVPVETRVGLVTWSSTIGAGYLYSAHKGPKDLANLNSTKINWVASASSKAATADLDFTTDFDTIRTTISARNSALMEGGTNMEAGLNAGIKLFTDDTDKTPWNRVIILFSDGQWSPDTVDPMLYAAPSAVANHIVVYTVGLLTNAGNTTLQDIATLTGGRYFRATTAAELEAAFQEIARLLPVILTQ